MQGKAILSTEAGGYVVADVDVGAPRAGEVLVAIRAAGVCHTDFDVMHRGTPKILGHEGAGDVLAVGAGVAHVVPGDRVLLNWAIPCGACFQCAAGNEAICEVNSPVIAGDGGPGHAHAAGTTWRGRPITRSFNLGTMSTATLVRGAAVVRLDVDIPYSSACILGCGVMTGYGSAVRAARVTPGSSVAVLGCGGVGLNVIQGARIAGAARIIAIDLGAARLELARRFGATDAVPGATDLSAAFARVRELTDGRGADFAFECTANPALGAAPLALVRNGGTAVQVSGIEQDLTIDMNLFEWDKVYINPLYGQCRPDVDFPRLLQLYADGELLLDEQVTQTYALADLDQAFAAMRRGEIAKGVLLLD